MKRIILMIVLFSLLNNAMALSLEIGGKIWAPDHFLVKFNSIDFINVQHPTDSSVVTNIPSIDSLIAKFAIYDAFRASRPEPTDPIKKTLFRQHGLHKWYVLKVRDGADIPAMVDSFLTKPIVEAAQPSFLYKPMYYPCDEYFPVQWGLRNTGANYPWPPDWTQFAGESDADIDVDSAWEIEKGDTTILIYILDTGIDTLHAEFSDYCVFDGSTYKQVKRRIPTWNQAPENDPFEHGTGHGTAVTSIAAGGGDYYDYECNGNQQCSNGISGICWYCKFGVQNVGVVECIGDECGWWGWPYLIGLGLQDAVYNTPQKLDRGLRWMLACRNL